MSLSLGRRAVIEALGTALLIATPVGSGVMAERLSAGAAVPWSGAHFNPVVSLTQGLPRNEVMTYVAAQIGGAIVGVMAVHLMFGLQPLQSGTAVRSGSGQVFGEFIATFGLVLVVTLCTSGKRPGSAGGAAGLKPTEFVAFAVASYIGAAYWFTSSTSFANPAGTVARAFTNTPAGIRFADVPGFLVGELAGAFAAFALARWLVGRKAA